MEINDELKQKLEDAETLTEMVAILRDAGFDCTEEQLKAVLDQTEGEMDERALDEVAGGCLRAIWDWIRGCAKKNGEKIGRDMGWN